MKLRDTVGEGLTVGQFDEVGDKLLVIDVVRVKEMVAEAEGHREDVLDPVTEGVKDTVGDSDAELEGVPEGEPITELADSNTNANIKRKIIYILWANLGENTLRECIWAVNRVGLDCRIQLDDVNHAGRYGKPVALEKGREKR